MLDKKKNGKVRFYHAKNDLKSYPFANCSKARQVFVDSKQHIWVATTEGIVVFNSNFKNIKTIPFVYYHKTENGANGLGTNDVHCISEDTEGNMWFGTFGGGLNKLKTRVISQNTKLEFELFDRTKGML